MSPSPSERPTTTSSRSSSACRSSCSWASARWSPGGARRSARWEPARLAGGGRAGVTGVGLLPAGAGSSAGRARRLFVRRLRHAAVVLEFMRGTRARKALGDRWLVVGIHRARRTQPPPLRRLRRPRSDRAPAYRRDRDRRLPNTREHGSPGRRMRVGDYGSCTRDRPSSGARTPRSSARELEVSRDGAVGSSRRARTAIFAEQQTSNEVAIRTDWLRGEDLFVIVDRSTKTAPSS